MIELAFAKPSESFTFAYISDSHGRRPAAGVAEAGSGELTKDTPVVVFSHSPLQQIYRGWNFWTEDAEQVQALLAPFEKVTVFYGHVDKSPLL